MIIESEIPFPELSRATPSEVDVRVEVGELGPIEAEPGRPRIMKIAGGLRFEIPDLARFEVTNGRAVKVDPVHGASSDLIRLYLLGTVMGIVLTQKGRLTLHGSLVEHDNGAVAFVGKSGSGKSTIANAMRMFHKSRILSDDLCSVDCRPSGQVLAYPGYPQSKLADSALAMLGLESADYRKVGRFLVKKAVPLGRGFCAQPRELKCIFFLDNSGSSPEPRRMIEGAERIGVLISNTYRGELLEPLGLLAEHFEKVAALAARVPLIHLSRPPLDSCLTALSSGIGLFGNFSAPSDVANPDSSTS